MRLVEGRLEENASGEGVLRERGSLSRLFGVPVIIE